MSWLRLFRSVALVTALLATSACIPVTVRKERVEPTLTMSSVEPDWNPFLSSDACLEATRDFRRVLGKIRKGVEYVEPEILWREVLGPEQTSPDQRARVLLDGLNAGGAARLKLRGLIILGRRTYHQDDADTQPLSVFYESLSQETVWQAVVLGWGGADSLPRQVMSTAKGIERDGWFPGYVLLFARLQKEVDTDGGSMRGLIKALFDTMPSEEAGVPTRIAVLAEATCGVPGR